MSITDVKRNTYCDYKLYVNKKMSNGYYGITVEKIVKKLLSKWIVYAKWHKIKPLNNSYHGSVCNINLGLFKIVLMSMYT